MSIVFCFSQIVPEVHLDGLVKRGAAEAAKIGSAGIVGGIRTLRPPAVAQSRARRTHELRVRPGNVLGASLDAVVRTGCVDELAPLKPTVATNAVELKCVCHVLLHNMRVTPA